MLMLIWRVGETVIVANEIGITVLSGGMNGCDRGSKCTTPSALR